MVAAAQDSELVEIVDHMLAKIRESVFSKSFRARTAPDMWAAAEAAAESAKRNAEAALAMLRMRGPAYFPLADAARDILITLAWMALAPPVDEQEPKGSCLETRGAALAENTGLSETLPALPAGFHVDAHRVNPVIPFSAQPTSDSPSVSRRAVPGEGITQPRRSRLLRHSTD